MSVSLVYLNQNSVKVCTFNCKSPNLFFIFYFLVLSCAAVPTSPLDATDLLSLPIVLLFSECSINGVLLCAGSCVWRLPLGLMLLRLICVVPCVGVSFGQHSTGGGGVPGISPFIG